MNKHLLSRQYLLRALLITVATGLSLHTALLITKLQRTVPRLPQLELLDTKDIPRPLASVGSPISQNTSVQVENSAPVLQGIQIKPDSHDELVVTPHSTLRLTSIGIYTTAEQIIRSLWQHKSPSNPTARTIANCEDTQTCVYTVGDSEGGVTITASAEGRSDHVNIVILRPATDMFIDTIPEWASLFIAALTRLDIVQGYDDGRYGPADQLRHGHVITLLSRTLIHLKLAPVPTGCQQYSDSVPTDHYAYEALCLFHKNGWANGYSFSPNAPATRAETAGYVNRVAGEALLKAAYLSQGSVLAAGQIFPDVPLYHANAYDIGVLKKTGVMTGNPDGNFDPGRILNRAEAATLTYRLLRILQDADVRSL